jgi:hypothetical protein
MELPACKRPRNGPRSVAAAAVAHANAVNAAAVDTATSDARGRASRMASHTPSKSPSPTSAAPMSCAIAWFPAYRSVSDGTKKSAVNAASALVAMRTLSGADGGASYEPLITRCAKPSKRPSPTCASVAIEVAATSGPAASRRCARL